MDYRYLGSIFRGPRTGVRIGYMYCRFPRLDEGLANELPDGADPAEERDLDRVGADGVGLGAVQANGRGAAQGVAGGYAGDEAALHLEGGEAARVDDVGLPRATKFKKQ